LILISAPRRPAVVGWRGWGSKIGITSAYISELKKLGIDWSRLRDDHVSGLARHDIAQAAYLFLLEHPEKTASYAIAAIIADGRRRAAKEQPLPDGIEEEASYQAEEGGPLPEAIEAAADVLKDGTAAAAVMLRCSRRRIQQLLAKEPLALAQRLAAAARQGELFGEGA
jgi:hypothetical protein